MKCPSCNQTASSFLRNSFSLQGVSFWQSLKGQLRCHHCNALLRNTKFGKQLWFLFGGMVIFMALLIFFSDRLYLSFGLWGVAAYWVILCIVFATIFMYGMWKYAVLEKVEEVFPNAPSS